MRSQCLRFSSELDLARLASQRRERSQVQHVPERDVLAAVLEFLKRHPKIAMAWRMNTAAGYVLDAKKYHALVAAGHLKPGDARFQRFAFKGCSDVIGVTRHGQFVAIEAKSDSGQLTDDQANFIEAVRACGGLGFVAYSLDDVMRELT
jgi:hypothetical protein